MPELRKRPAPPPAPPPAKKKAPPKTKTSSKKENGSTMASETAGPPKSGDTITLEDFGGEVETNDESKVTLAKLVGESKAGVVLFTYPKASTPGCTTQVCLFRDSYEPLTATGLSIYGLSNDSPKANTNFKEKQNLPYPLLCDPKQTLIGAIGMKKSPSGTTRGVFVVDKNGKVLAAEPGGPAPTVEVVKKLVQEMGGDSGAEGLDKAEERAAADKVGGVENKKVADIAAEVADSAAAIDRMQGFSTIGLDAMSESSKRKAGEMFARIRRPQQRFHSSAQTDDQLVSSLQNGVNIADTPHSSHNRDMAGLKEKSRGTGRVDDEECNGNARLESFRLQTLDAIQDLQRWLTSPNSCLDGDWTERNIDFLRSHRFTNSHFQDAIAFAIEEIRNAHQQINSLAEYGQRRPYFIKFSGPAAPDADLEYFQMRAEDFVGAPRDGLEDDLLQAAIEIDYLRQVSEQLANNILNRKKWLARSGDQAEIEALLRLGITE